MTTVMSTIGEVAGVKPDDAVIGQGMMVMAKLKSTAYLNAILEASSPELRHLFTQHLQDALAEHEKFSVLAIKRGWYKTSGTPQDLLREAVKFAEQKAH